jgi:TPR repeat protein
MALEVTSITSLLTHWSTPRLRALFADDPRQAAQWASVLADEGLPAAQLCYGRMLLAGTGTARDATAALKWFRRAADKGDIDAVNMVGRCLDNGWGAAEDPAAAAVHYQRAADIGHAWAQYNLGHLYLDGRGVARNVDQAYAWYLRAAEQGHERAMNLVGRCREEGWGTPRDPAAAADWYRRSAEAGYFRGQYNWATLLLKAGHPDQAVAWFERAATGGTPGICSAIIDTIERDSCGAGTDGALHRLAARLKDQSTGIVSGH